MTTAIAPMASTYKTPPANMDKPTAADLVSPALKRVEAVIHDLPDVEPDGLRKAVEIILNSGGKRIRPTIALLVAGMLGVDPPDDNAVNLAAAVEMLHTATLVHDDLIDGSLMRRGAATLNAAWTPAATVLTGDFLFAYAAKLASQANSVQAMSIFADTLCVMVAGELRQGFSDWATRSTHEDYLRRIYAKTASMFVLATTAMASVCGASPRQTEALREFGREFGMSFQIIDDVLDFSGEQQVVGKPVGSDLRRGLITLPTLRYAEAHASDPDLACAMRGECDRATYDRLVERIRHSEAIDASRQDAAAAGHRAILALRGFPESPQRAALIGLVDEYARRVV
jgi:geranylgeranyl pyrophosphate synthase